MKHYLDAIGDHDFMEFDEADEEPSCEECGCGLFTEEHAFDCSIGDEEANEDEE